MGQTLEAIATTDGLSAITNGFFSSGEMKFKSYFDEEGKEKSEKITDVNQKATVIFELSPNDIGKGFLKEGIISANSLDENDINFKFSKIKNITIDEPAEPTQTNNDVGVDDPVDPDQTNEPAEPTQNSDNLENNVFDETEENTIANEMAEESNTIGNEPQNTI